MKVSFAYNENMSSAASSSVRRSYPVLEWRDGRMDAKQFVSMPTFENSVTLSILALGCSEVLAGRPVEENDEGTKRKCTVQKYCLFFSCCLFYSNGANTDSSRIHLSEPPFIR